MLISLGKTVSRCLLYPCPTQLRRELESVRHHRRQYRDKRSATPIPVVGMCGYTNAGAGAGRTTGAAGWRRGASVHVCAQKPLGQYVGHSNNGLCDNPQQRTWGDAP